MRSRLLPVLLLPLASGCIDSLGLGSSCATEMRTVRLSEGRQPDDTQRVEEGGNFRELWIYGRTRYTFRWGPSYDSCQVEGPSRFSRSGEDVGF